jgi:hypothetical protein
MSNVIKFERGKGRNKTSCAPESSAPPGGDDGEIRFTVHGDESQLHLTGVYEKRLQFGIYTMIKGISALADKLAANGAIGDSSFGPIHEPLPSPIRRTPRRLLEETDFGGLK